jgi:hypothetical protein
MENIEMDDDDTARIKVTPEAVLRALATAESARSMEVDETTSNAELDAFLFGDDALPTRTYAMLSDKQGCYGRHQ